MMVNLEFLEECLRSQERNFATNVETGKIFTGLRGKNLTGKFLLLRLMEVEGILQFEVPQLLNLSDCQHLESVLKALQTMNDDDELVSFSYNSSNGEVSASIKLSLHDSEMTSQSVEKVLAQLEKTLDVFTMPRLQRVKVTGVDEKTEKGADLIAPMGGANLLERFLEQLLQAEINGGQSSVFNVLAQHLELVNENLGKDLIEHQKRWLSNNNNPELREFVAGRIENISVRLTNFPLGSSRGKIVSAIAGYQYVISLRTDNPRKTAQTQNNLGSAYIDLAPFSENPKQEIMNAINSFRNALQVNKESELPQDFANTQTNLGCAYWSLAKFSENPKQWLEQAIDSYHNALRVYKEEAKLAQNYATTQNNLGNAYWSLAQVSGNPKQDLELAIVAYGKASRVYRESEFPQDFAMIQNNLGVAYWTLGQVSENPKQDLEWAINFFRKALRVYTESKLPQKFAITQNNLGNSYKNLAGFSENPKQDLEQAIAAYGNALRACKKAEMSQDFLAMIQNNLGLVYSDLAPFSANPKQEIESTIASYRNALRVHSSDMRSADCLKTARNFGNFGIKQGLWEIAIEGYSKAVEAVENIRSWSKDEARREEVQANSIEIYSNIVQAHINLNQFAQAFAYVERSRSKRLLNLMHVQDSYKNGEIPTEVKQLLDQIDYQQNEIDKIYHPYNQNHNLATADTLRRTPKDHEQAKIDYHRREINRLYQEVRQRDPLSAAGTRVANLDLNAAAQLLQGSTTTALLNFFNTSENTYIFIIRLDSNLPAQGECQGVRVDLHLLENEGIENLHDWIFDEWIAQSQNNRQQWEANAQEFLKELSQKLQINHLITNHLQGITELILIPHLCLHQIPFIALPIDPSVTLLPLRERQGVRANYLGDHFTIRYAPSCQVLQFCQARDHIPEPLTYGIVAGASRDVPYANFQGSEIAKLCHIPPTAQLKGISETTKTAYKQLLHQANIFHAYHHANFDFSEPLNASLTVADGDILLAQILTWRLPNLSDIFLSCCETGLGLSKKLTDDIFTIASGFLCVGARTVFSTLWSVDQLSAALICILYYRDRSAHPHHRKAQSLQIAQNQLREMTGEQLETEFADALQQSIRDYINQLRDYALSFPEGTAERNTANQNFKQSQSLEDHLNTLCDKDHPFENPTSWAAFTCQGLG